LSNEEDEEKIYARSSEGALRQGEIISNLGQVILNPDCLLVEGREPVVDPVIHPWAIVMTQDCDLDWDYKARQPSPENSKIIPSILFCEVITAEKLAGKIQASDLWKKIRQNKDERYQYLKKISANDDVLSEGVPALGIDFKRYFSIPTAEVYVRLKHTNAKRRSQLQTPYREHLSERFFYFQMRIALPSEHYSEEAAR